MSGGLPGRAVPRGGQALALGTLCTLLFLTFLDNTVVSVALGDIQVSLKANVSDLQWVVGAYALTFASIMLACGMIGDELGRKKVMLAGAGVFCAGSVLCACRPMLRLTSSIGRPPKSGRVTTTISPPDLARTSSMMRVIVLWLLAGRTFAKSLTYP